MFISQASKVCVKCRAIKPFSEFYVRPKSKDGFDGSCKQCISNHQAKYYIENKPKIIAGNKRYRLLNKEKIREYGLRYYKEKQARKPKPVIARVNLTEKTCCRCGRLKPISEYGIRKNRPDGLTYHCKECARKRVKNYRIQNKEKYLASAKRSRDKNKVKVTEYNKKYREKNKLKWKEYNKKYVASGQAKIGQQKFLKSASGKKWIKEYRKKHSEAVTDMYLKKRIVSSHNILYSKIPPEMIELERYKVIIKRKFDL